MNRDDSPWSSLVIRVWFTDLGELRARITELAGFDSPGRSVAVSSSVEEVLDTVASWLAGFRSPATEPPAEAP